MKKIKIKNTNLEVSQIAYGCMNIGGNWNKAPLTTETTKNAEELINLALENDINFFDHADIYTFGKSEEVFGEVLKKKSSLREQIILQSKCSIRFENEPFENCPGRYDFSYEHIVNSTELILKRLNTEYLDILLLHRPDPLCEPEEVAKAFDMLFQQGKVKYFGVSNHNHLQIELLSKYLSQPLITNQMEFNLIHNHLINDGVVCNLLSADNSNLFGTLDYCRLKDIYLQAWSPLAKGNIYLDNKYIELRKVINKLSIQKSVPEEAIIIAWILRHPAKIQPVVGTTNKQRLINSIKAVDVELSREEWYELFIAARNTELP